MRGISNGVSAPLPHPMGRQIPRLGARPSNGELEGRERETDRHGVNSMRVFILR